MFMKQPMGNLLLTPAAITSYIVMSFSLIDFAVLQKRQKLRSNVTHPIHCNTLAHYFQFYFVLSKKCHIPSRMDMGFVMDFRVIDMKIVRFPCVATVNKKLIIRLCMESCSRDCCLRKFTSSWNQPRAIGRLFQLPLSLWASVLSCFRQV